MPLNVSDIVQVSYRGVWNAQKILLNTTYQVTATTSAGTILQDLATICGTFNSLTPGTVMETYLQCMPSNYNLDVVRAQRIYPNRSVYYDVFPNVPGLHAAQATTGNLQHPLTFHTEFGGRNQVSIRKIGPAPSTAYANGEPTTAYKTLLGAAGNAQDNVVITLAPQITLQPVIWHWTLLNWTNIVGYRIPTRTGTMRRRTLRVGE